MQIQKEILSHKWFACEINLFFRVLVCAEVKVSQQQVKVDMNEAFEMFRSVFFRSHNFPSTFSLSKTVFGALMTKNRLQVNLHVWDFEVRKDASRMSWQIALQFQTENSEVCIDELTKTIIWLWRWNALLLRSPWSILAQTIWSEEKNSKSICEIYCFSFPLRKPNTRPMKKTNKEEEAQEKKIECAREEKMMIKKNKTNGAFTVFQESKLTVVFVYLLRRIHKHTYFIISLSSPVCCFSLKKKHYYIILIIIVFLFSFYSSFVFMFLPFLKTNIYKQIKKSNFFQFRKKKTHLFSSEIVLVSQCDKSTSSALCRFFLDFNLVDSGLFLFFEKKDVLCHLQIGHSNPKHAFTI